MEKIIRPPFPYTGNKSKLLPQILPHFPNDINNFIDLFSGSCVVTANVDAKKFYVNEISEPLLYLNRFLKDVDVSELDEMIKFIMDNYSLPESGDGYYRLRTHYNRDKSPIKLLVLVYHSINSLFRFNSSGGYNASYSKGKNTYKELHKEKLIEFNNALVNRDIEFSLMDFREFEFNKDGTGDLIYVDSPYLLSEAQYNNKWSTQDDMDLYNLMDELSDKGYKFVLSNALVSKGNTNTILENWMKKYNVFYLDIQYTSWANTRGDNKNTETIEVLVKNF